MHHWRANTSATFQQFFPAYLELIHGIDRVPVSVCLAKDARYFLGVCVYTIKSNLWLPQVKGNVAVVMGKFRNVRTNHYLVRLDIQWSSLPNDAAFQIIILTSWKVSHDVCDAILITFVKLCHIEKIYTSIQILCAHKDESKQCAKWVQHFQFHGKPKDCCDNLFPGKGNTFSMGRQPK